MARVAVGFLVFLLALGTHAAAGLWTLFASCQISDTASRVPAPASFQGRVCDAQDHWLNAAPYVVLGVSVVLSVVLVVVWWNTKRRWLGVTACVWLAVISAALLAVPPDSCRASQVADQPRWACSTVGNG